MPIANSLVPSAHPVISSAMVAALASIGPELMTNFFNLEIDGAPIEGNGPQPGYELLTTAQKLALIRRLPAGDAGRLAMTGYELMAVAAITNEDRRFWVIGVTEYVESVAVEVEPSGLRTGRCVWLMSNALAKPKVYSTAQAALKDMAAVFDGRADPLFTTVANVGPWMPNEDAGLGDPAELVAKELGKMESLATKLASMKTKADSDLAAATALGWNTGNAAQQARFSELQASVTSLTKQLAVVNAKIAELNAAGT